MYNNQERASIFIKRLLLNNVLNEKKLSSFYVKQTGYKKGSELPKMDATWERLTGDFRFSGLDKHYWLYAKVDIPEEMQGKNNYLQLCTGLVGWDAINPQFMVYINGKLVQGADVNHMRVKLDKDLQTFDLHLYAYTGLSDPNYFTGEVNDERSFCFSSSLVEIDALCEKVYYDMKVLYDILCYTEETDKAYGDISLALGTLMDCIDLRMPKSKEYFQSLQVASDYADKEIYGKLCQKTFPKVMSVGHTHIDIAWMWTVAQTREKAQRSFATVIANMKQYPQYKFMSSQALLYENVKEECPQLYDEIKSAIKSGQWEVEGSMWVEADCNLTSGESLVRQILYGKTYFQDEFGIDTKVLWEPDVFGYSAALPQIMKKSGVDKFVTSKISWNDTNQMPYDIFSWKGIDGSEVFTYFLTAQRKQKGKKPQNYTTYVPQADASFIAGTWDRLTQKELTDEAIITYGWGDGGGGPTQEDLEHLSRFAYGIPNCPTTEFSTATAFLDKLYEKTKEDENLPIWDGELYLEFHRGTYTSQAKNKKYNRKAEFGFQNVEWLYSMSNTLLGTAYPTATLHNAWKTILKNQFHDILPGTSIKEVYEVTDKEYAELFKTADMFTQTAVQDIADALPIESGYVVFNPTSYNVSTDVYYDGKYYSVTDISPKGYKTVALKETPTTVKIVGKTFENNYYKIQFNDDYEMQSILHKKTNRELLKAGCTGNKLIAYDDTPVGFDAWELRDYHKQKSWQISNVDKVEIVSQGARTGVKIKRSFCGSSITQTVYLYDTTERIDVENDIDWQTEHICLKAYFPVDINSKKATFDIQFGNLERTMSNNTSWDKAQFEVCAHKFADISDGNFGVALMNDCKYGYDVKNGNLGITLLKCATYPAGNCDKGNHTFTYSIYAHEGTLNGSDTTKQAFILNNPLQVYKVNGKGNGKLPCSYSYVQADKENVVIDTIKQAEKRDTTIVRMYESNNTPVTTTLTFGSEIKEVYLCDLLENRLEKIAVKNNQCTIKVKSFEIITLEIVKIK